MRRLTCIGVLAVALSFSACQTMDMSSSSVMKTWPKTSMMVAQEVIAKYGEPNEITPSMMVWYNNGPWKRTMLSRDTVLHSFPGPHPDLLEQVINYRVPSDKYDELSFYDGSVIVERTKGEMSARCDKEGANMLALNLANDIITGAKTVDQAREFYSMTIMNFKKGITSPYMEKLLFSMQGNTADPDGPVR